MGAILELKDISMNYHEPSGETKAIGSINFSVEEGEFISIIGPSGCGKSTLLSIISGLVQPSGGQILIQGKEIQKSQASIGYMLQKDHLFEWRSIFQNTILGLEIQNSLTEENTQYVNHLLDQYGLGEFKKYSPSQLSGGAQHALGNIF